MLRAAILGGLLSTLALPACAQDAAPVEPDVLIADMRIMPWHGPMFAQAAAFHHPSWGERHARRDYALALQLAQAEGLTIDHDVITAAAYLHDWGGLEPWEVEGAPHQVRSVELAEPFLRDAGFPMEKFPAVRDAILGHVPAGEPTTSEGVVLHDADLLDFLGAEGVARLLAATGEEPTMDRSLTWIEDFAQRLPGLLITAEARRLAEPRVAYMRAFVERLRSELPPGTEP